jgi:hypothetical protein
MPAPYTAGAIHIQPPVGAHRAGHLATPPAGCSSRKIGKVIADATQSLPDPQGQRGAEQARGLQPLQPSIG